MSTISGSQSAIHGLREQIDWLLNERKRLQSLNHRLASELVKIKEDLESLRVVEISPNDDDDDDDQQVKKTGGITIRDDEPLTKETLLKILKELRASKPAPAPAPAPAPKPVKTIIPTTPSFLSE
jgi:hypothetical protein